MTEDMDVAEQKRKEQYENNREIILRLAKEGKLPEPRKLTHGERKRLDAAKVNVFKIEAENDKRSYFTVRDEMSDWIVTNIYPDFKGFDDIDNNIVRFFGEYVFGLSYRDDLAEKN
ncbi:MAG: hypothetical protein K0Q85_29 [Caproiciproducens sp.]|nr:hypothetical protein [Caproiciproducens sp.]